MIFSQSILERSLRYVLFFPVVILFSVLGNAESTSDKSNASHFSFVIDTNLIASIEGDLAVDIDGYDVTSFSRISDGFVTTQLNTPLMAGVHSYNVYILMVDGNVGSLLEETIEIAEDDRVSNWQFIGTLDSSYRLDEKEAASFQGVKHLAGNGDASLRGRERLDKWELSTELDLIYDSRSENHSDNNEWALPNYRVALNHYGDSVTSAVSIGEQAIVQDDLLFSSFQRRGAMIDVLSTNALYNFNVFALQSETSNRYDGHLLPVNEERNSGVGMTAGVALAGEYLQLSTGFIHGETTIAGAGVITAEGDVLYGGDSWNMALDSRALQRSLWLHLEYAQSQFDSDGIGLGEGEKRDNARQATLQLSSEGQLGTGVFDYWSTQLQYQSVGGNFYSLGNLFLPGDRELSRFVVRAGLVGFNFDLEWAEEESNVDNLSILPTQTLERIGGGLNYSPPNLDANFWLWRNLGTPSVSASSYQTEHHQPRMDSLMVGYDLNSQVDDNSLMLLFSRQFWNWSVQYQVVERDERTQAVVQNGFLLFEPSSDQKNTMVNVQVGYMPNPRLMVNLFSQRSELIEIDSGNEFNSRNYSIESYLQVVPKVVSLAANFSYGRNYSDIFGGIYRANDNKNHIANLQLSWHVIKPIDTNPGLDLYLRGSYGKYDERVFGLEAEQWSMHVGVKLYWSQGEQ